MKKLILAAAAVVGAMAGGPAYATEAGDWLVRGRLLGIIPDESATTSIGGSVEISNQVVPEVDATYFFSKNVGVEVIAGVTKHDVKHTPTNTDLGSVWLLPPTVTLQYHFNPDGQVKPYVGAGVNFTHFFNADAGALSSVDYKDTWGWALQAGVDVKLQDNLYFNLDVKKIQIEPDVVFNGGGVTASVDINPVVVGVGVGKIF